MTCVVVGVLLEAAVLAYLCLATTGGAFGRGEAKRGEGGSDGAHALTEHNGEGPPVPAARITAAACCARCEFTVFFLFVVSFFVLFCVFRFFFYNNIGHNENVAPMLYMLLLQLIHQKNAGHEKLCCTLPRCCASIGSSVNSRTHHSSTTTTTNTTRPHIPTTCTYLSPPYTKSLQKVTHRFFSPTRSKIYQYRISKITRK